MKVKIKKADDLATIPTYATDGSGCFDLYAVVEKNPNRVESVSEYIPRTFRTGLVFEIPEDHVMLIFSRSGHGFNNDVRLSNCVGVIDHDYRGEVVVKLAKDSGGTFVVNTGDRIAQAIIIQRPKVEFELVDELSATSRGEGGFGHTGN